MGGLHGKQCGKSQPQWEPQSKLAGPEPMSNAAA
jgi:hypothetical protein